MIEVTTGWASSETQFTNFSIILIDFLKIFFLTRVPTIVMSKRARLYIERSDISERVIPLHVRHPFRWIVQFVISRSDQVSDFIVKTQNRFLFGGREAKQSCIARAFRC